MDNVNSDIDQNNKNNNIIFCARSKQDVTFVWICVFDELCKMTTFMIFTYNMLHGLHDVNQSGPIISTTIASHVVWGEVLDHGLYGTYVWGEVLNHGLYLCLGRGTEPRTLSMSGARYWTTDSMVPMSGARYWTTDSMVPMSGARYWTTDSTYVWGEVLNHGLYLCLGRGTGPRTLWYLCLGRGTGPRTLWYLCLGRGTGPRTLPMSGARYWTTDSTYVWGEVLDRRYWTMDSTYVWVEVLDHGLYLCLGEVLDHGLYLCLGRGEHTLIGPILSNLHW